jgi:S-DNA-T family DNA segregation ATPase FtsK/SpoIIIE
VVVVEHLDRFPLSFEEIEKAFKKAKKTAKDSSFFYFVTLSSLSVGAVTSELKRHFQTRIVFRTASTIDSVTLLGESGAERLKKGQFYLLPASQVLSEMADPLLLHLPS